ncbi:MAG: hypothetical protein RMK99_09225 [Anaerolineales bacterium]|nr:hypothetical protein [Anaerolineales bacterium]
MSPFGARRQTRAWEGRARVRGVGARAAVEPRQRSSDHQHRDDLPGLFRTVQQNMPLVPLSARSEADGRTSPEQVLNGLAMAIRASAHSATCAASLRMSQTDRIQRWTPCMN